MAPKSTPKSMLSSKGGFSKKPCFSIGKTYIFEIRGFEVGIKNRSKIDVKNDTETERLGNSILIDFCSILEPSWASKTEPRRSKIDVEKASKFDQFLKASWNSIFSAQEAPRGASAVFRRCGRSRPEATGGGFRRGKQEPPRRRIRKEDGRKDSETSCARLARRPRWAAD